MTTTDVASECDMTKLADQLIVTLLKSNEMPLAAKAGDIDIITYGVGDDERYVAPISIRTKSAESLDQVIKRALKTAENQNPMAIVLPIPCDQ